jgi:hypothetical protein
VTWIDILVWAALLIGIAAGGYIVARHPAFWISFGTQLFWKIWPYVWPIISKRMTPEEEAAWRKEQLTKPNPQPMPSKFPKRDR